MIVIFDENIRPLVLILPKLSRYVKHLVSGYLKTLKNGDLNKNKKLMFLRVDDNKLLEKYKTIWTKTEDLKILNWMHY